MGLFPQIFHISETEVGLPRFSGQFHTLYLRTTDGHTFSGKFPVEMKDEDLYGWPIRHTTKRESRDRGYVGSYHLPPEVVEVDCDYYVDLAGWRISLNVCGEKNVRNIS